MSEPTARVWDPSTAAISPEAKALVEEAVLDVRRIENEITKSNGARPRALSAQNRLKAVATVGALILDALAHAISQDTEYLLIKLDNNWLARGPKEQPARNGTVGDRLSALELSNWLEVNRSLRINQRFRTCYWAGPMLLKRAKALGVELKDIGSQGESQSIELRTAKDRSDVGFTREIHFRPTAETQIIETRVRELNQHLQAGLIENRLGSTPPIDVRRRHVKRVFLEGDFQRGGRTGGPAFWLNLPKVRRRHDLLLDAGPVAEIDIQAAIPSIAYALVGKRPQEDPYGIPSLTKMKRGMIKIALMQLFWRRHSPRGRFSDEVQAHIKGHYRYREVVDAIREWNAPIAHMLGAEEPIGATLMWHESEIIIDATLRAFKAGATALPLHDALIMPASQIELGKHVLEGAFRDRLGVPPTLKVDFDGSRLQLCTG